MGAINLQLIFLSLVTIVNIVLAIWVYKNNPRSATNRIFGFLGASVAVWIMTMYLAQAPQFISQSLLITRLSTFFAAPMNALFLLLAYTLPSAELSISKRFLVSLFTITIILMVLSFTPFFFQRVDIINGFPVPITGPALGFFGIISILENIGAVYVLARRLFHSEGLIREHLRIVMLGIILMFGMIISAIFIPVLIFNNASLVPLTPVFTSFFLIMVAYSIIHDGLLDVRLIVARTVSFVFVNLLLAIMYGGLVYWFITNAPLVLQGIALEISSLSVLVIAILSFKYVEDWLIVISGKIFFKKEYNPDELLDRLTRIMASTIELNELTQSLLKKLTDEMGIMKAVFIVFDEHKITDISGIGYSLDQIKSVEFDLIFHSPFKSQHFLFDDMEESPMKHLLRTFDISFALPIFVDGKDVAVLLLGRKLSGDIYFDRDVNFLDLFAREAGIAIQNSKAYNEIKIFNKELENRVESRTKDLKESQERELEKAKSVAKLKDEFVFVAAHELRAPITAIRGFLELVTGTNKKVPKDVSENLQEIQYASDHLNQLVNDLLEIARSEADQMKVSMESVDLDSMVDEILKELAPLGRKNKVKLRNGTFYALKAMADKSKVKEILVNLISNAIKYNKNNGLVFVQIVAVPGTDKVFVEIRDTGYGIPLDQQNKIFGKFFRANSENSAQILGTGLGLFLARMLVQKMGGEISFTSVPNEGTTFSFYLKRAE